MEKVQMCIYLIWPLKNHWWFSRVIYFVRPTKKNVSWLFSINNQLYLTIINNPNQVLHLLNQQLWNLLHKSL